ncbi:alpha/beta hydrolase [Marinoscillum sp. MHG1-6]|uniref:alpha/beta hydrolase n=1 Tax=Marinoscillum sp. MHG1-6 TaxID=2959627 RepID=UPI00215780DD|nr:alpha/beta hydrolase [Marinoscillum sp. MHG1-6]
MKDYKIQIALTSLCLFGALMVVAQQRIEIESTAILYKQVDTTQLYLHMYRPLDFDDQKTYKAIMFIHGGGWNQGDHKAFKRQCMYFASRGMITFSIDYRVKDVHGTTPFDATQDAYHAYQYLLKHARKLSIDKKNIVVGGGSAGGHLATTTAFWGKSKERPAALLLFNPVLDTGPEGFGYQRMEGRHEEISPIDNIGENQPPTIIMVGTNDKVLPVPTAKRYKSLMEEAGQVCRLVLYEGQEHAFFARKPIKFFIDTTDQCDQFLQELGLIEGESTITEQYGEYEVEVRIL